MKPDLQNASCRVALAAYLHDLGKFAERARIPEASTKDADGNTRADIEKQLNCPVNRDGRSTHVHAAYTAIAMDLLEENLPDIVGDEMKPFAPWRQRNADDSIINAAARHHRPDTFLQWIIATADRLASGFEREEFEEYNQASDETQDRKLDHYTTRQETLLERIRLADREQSSVWRYALKALSPAALFPLKASECENESKAEAQKKYLQLWNEFKTGLKEIPKSHRSNLELWLDHFDCLWQTYTHAIPSATAGIGGKIRPDVALYDHSKTTAALAVALWRYHTERDDDLEAIRKQLKAQWDREFSHTDASMHAWNDEKFLLIQGDLFGIQNFIFAEGGQTNKRAAKLLRGRSFYVSLLSELAALRVLDALALPATSQVVNAAGKFLIVAPNTKECAQKLEQVQKELNDWFLLHTYGQSGIGLAWLPAKSSDFLHGTTEKSPFRNLMNALFKQLDTAKLRRLDLCNSKAGNAVFEDFLERFAEHGVCSIDGHSPAVMEKDGVQMSALAADQIDIGKWLVSEDRLLVTRKRIAALQNSQTLNQTQLDIFGYALLFTRDEERSGKFGGEAKSGNLLRAWDFSLPEGEEDTLWNGYARRHINAYVPRFGEMNEWQSSRYDGIENGELFDPHPDEIKTLNHIACDDRRPDESGKWLGVQALMTLKGDVDNLGQIFQKGLERPTFARMAALSRQVNAFFAIHLPNLCSREFPDTYTVFAGGDDFFLIGPWHATIKLAQRMKEDFRHYVAENPDIHFSAGLSMTKPGLPIRQLAHLAEAALDSAKAYNPARQMSAPKNAVSCFGYSVSWSDFDELIQRSEGLARVAGDYALSTGYLYGLLQFADMAAQIEQRPENALWHSRFAYRTRRLVEMKIKAGSDRREAEEKRRRLQEDLATEIAGLGIEKHGAAYKIALFTYLYQQRD